MPRLDSHRSDDRALERAGRRALDDDDEAAARARGCVASSSSRLRDVARAVVAGEHGALKCSFRDGVNAVLDGSGTGVTMHADGKTTRQLTAYATSRWRARVTAALEIRNAFAETPHYVPRMLRTSEDGDASSLSETRLFETEVDFTHVRFDRRLVQATSHGWFASTSLCGCAIARLSPYGLVLEVCYPARVGEVDGGSARQYVWQKQQFLAARAPSRWSVVVQTLSRASAAASGDAEDADEAKNELDCIFTVVLPRPTLGSESLNGMPWDTSRDDARSWWASTGLNSYDADAQPFVEWTPECTIWACTTLESHRREGGVRLDGCPVRCFALLANDGRVVACAASSHDEYKIIITHGAPSGEAPRRVRLEEVATEDDAQLLLQVIERLRRFERALGGVRRRGEALPRIEPSDTFAATSMDSIRQVIAHDSSSEFVAYADGRVRAVFGDRTMLLFDRPREFARLILRDGARVTVRIAAPTTAKSYVLAARAFANEVWPESSSMRAPNAVDVVAAATRNEDWLQWYRTSASIVPSDPLMSSSTIASSPRHAFASSTNRLDIVSQELAKTQAWFVSRGGASGARV